jgi:site-specific recombinase XerC
MTTIDPITAAVVTQPDGHAMPGEAELAAVAFLARYSGRTLDAYRHDLRALFQWAEGCDLRVLEATRAHLELRSAVKRNRPSSPRSRPRCSLGYTLGRRTYSRCLRLSR